MRRHAGLGCILIPVCLAACGREIFDFPGDAGARIVAAPDAGADASSGTACAVDATRCADACVRLDRDPLHCGGCGVVCPEKSSVCDVGTCRAACTGGRSACEGACVETRSDPEHCGGCNVACTGGAVCDRGTCACSAGTQRCGNRCVETSSDRTNCGACGRGCPASSVCGNGVCQP